MIGSTLEAQIFLKIQNRLDRTEAWAREHYDGPAKEIEEFVEQARAETLDAIADKFDQEYPQHRQQHPCMVSNQN